jgi:hypothetical protein
VRAVNPRTWSRFALVVLLAACGTRSGLLSDTEAPDPGFPVADAALDAPVADARPDTDSSTDAGLDAADGEVDAFVDIDALPPIEAGVADVDRRDCTDPSQTLIYVVSSQNDLYAFDPPTSSFRLVGPLSCPAAAGETPFSMAVDRNGVAYVVYSDGNLFRVSTRSGACAATPFAPNQSGFSTFGMGFSSEAGGPAERLFVMHEDGNGVNPSQLGWIDTRTFKLNIVGTTAPPLGRSELTGTGDGRLFAYAPDDFGNGSALAQLDKSNARVIGRNRLQAGGAGQAFAFAFWGNDFYIFNSPGGATTVTRYRPADNSEVVVATTPATIVGAGVSTCAPQ